MKWDSKGHTFNLSNHSEKEEVPVEEEKPSKEEAPVEEEKTEAPTEESSKVEDKKEEDK